MMCHAPIFSSLINTKISQTHDGWLIIIKLGQMICSKLYKISTNAHIAVFDGLLWFFGDHHRTYRAWIAFDGFVVIIRIEKIRQ